MLSEVEKRETMVQMEDTVKVEAPKADDFKGISRLMLDVKINLRYLDGGKRERQNSLGAKLAPIYGIRGPETRLRAGSGTYSNLCEHHFVLDWMN